MLSVNDLNRIKKQLLVDKENFKSNFQNHSYIYQNIDSKIFVQYLSNNEEVKKLIDNIFLPNKNIYLKDLKYYYRENCNESFFSGWIVSLINLYSQEINSFLEFKGKYEQCVFSNDYLNAKELLKIIEENFGYSFWIINQKLLISEKLEGLESHKIKLSNYLSESNNNAITIALLEFFSYSAEDKMSLNNYQKTLEEFLKPEKNAIIFKYLDFVLSHKYKYDFCKVLDILQLTSQNSIIDLYETLIKLMQLHYVSYKNTLLNFMGISNFIEDHRLRNLRFILSKSQKDFNNILSKSKEFLGILELFNIENYEGIIKVLDEKQINKTLSFQESLLLVKSNDFLGNAVKYDYQILNDFSDLYNMINDDKTIESIELKVKQALKLSYREKLIVFCQQKKINYEYEVKVESSYLNDEYISPKLLHQLDFDKRKRISILEENYKLSYYLIFNPSRLVQVKKNITIEFAEIKYKLLHGDILNAICGLEDLYKSIEKLVPHNKERIIYNLINAYSATTDLLKATDIYVFWYLKNPNYLRRVNDSLLYEQINASSNLPQIKESINVLLFYKMYKNSDETKIIISLSNFFWTKKIDSLGMLKQYMLEHYQKNQTVFFLSEICTSYILEREATLVEDKIESQNIRIEILKILIDIDSLNSKKYYLEISNIEKKKLIKGQLKLINSSRITVDTDNIFNDNKDIFLETYNQFIDQMDFKEIILTFDINSEEFRKKLIQAIGKVDEKLNYNKEKNSAYIILEKLTKWMTKEFLFNEKYGLDSYLSSRIRHGYLKSQLTDILSDHNLLSKRKTEKSVKYDFNPFWENKFLAPDLTASKFLSILDKFTNSIELLIAKVKDKWIRIKLTNSDEGVLDYTSFAINFVRQYTIFQSEPESFQLFFTYLIDSLWKYTEVNLVDLRKLIENDLLNTIYQLMLDLEKNIKLLDNTNNSTVINEAIGYINKCRPLIKNRVYDFSSVLNKKDLEYNDFKLHDLINSSIEVTSNIYNSFSFAKYDVKCDVDSKFKGKYFTHFVDIVNILLNNVIEHSGFNSAKDNELDIVSILINQNSDKFNLIVEELKE